METKSSLWMVGNATGRSVAFRKISEVELVIARRIRRFLFFSEIVVI
jgi:hypothetical protein